MTETMDIQTQLAQRWLVFWCALALGLLAIGVARHKGFFKPLVANYSPPIQGIDIIRGFGLFIVIEILVIPFYFGIIYGLGDGDFNNLSSHVKGWLNFFMVLGGFTAALIAYFSLSLEKRNLLWRQTAESRRYHAWLGVTAWFVCFPIILAFNQLVSIAMWHLFHHPFAEQSFVITLREAKEHPFLFTSLAVVIVTLVPFTEEFLFRGLLQTWIKRKLKGPWLAIIFSSIVFSLFHFTSSQGITNIEVLSTLFLLSCMIGYVFERQGSLWAPIGLHAFFNFMSLLMIFID